MIIDSLSLLDFRVFRGSHNFDLVPKLKKGKNAPIVLFGGLNGGGKTTILLALKLALYGKGVLGQVASTSEYHQYLKECIHRAHNSIAKPTRSALELSFRYAQHGVISTYNLLRDWHVDPSGKVKEGLVISKDGNLLAELSYDQAQSFLNELIPIGVSELFFFDGEKIASLAEETTGDALRDSINKLLGLDLIDRLDSDLSVLVRTRAAKKTSEERRKKISQLEAEHNRLTDGITLLREEILKVRRDIGEVSSALANVSSNINARGGAWSLTKKEEAARLDELVIKKRAIEGSLHELLSSLAPLALTRNLNEALLSQLASEQEASKVEVLAEYLENQQEKLISALMKALPSSISNRASLDEAYLSVFGAVIEERKGFSAKLHDLSESSYVSINYRLSTRVDSDLKRVRILLRELDEIDSSIDSIGENIARAPDENVLIPLFKEQGVLQGRLSELKDKKVFLADRVKEALNKLSPVVRHLDELHTEVNRSQEDGRAFSLAERARYVLKEFSIRAREAKLRELETQFYSSFNSLARKEDRRLAIKISPDSFEVELHDETSQAIKKSELSAGEKQIFAISILEALARTSGRSLPVVIDTPLGRLDSLHRKKLLDNYFPKTSHQVVILSTDTEIDCSFYERLRPHVSHSYHLVYSPETRSTQVEEGYFWRWSENV
ncbi:TPA: DNA sulfur modification protein DndD [Pseudomonas aeruginosa]|uniref:DNA sulfur modification protein DndD n=1 Tax=Pseudomonas aeruginosa TaxID=287 RepID=UPI002D7BB72C|nr:DNA sulfur modification protein DndD [Pseudomonas aeruginosa]HEP8178476.1 DNA sulfur modification protein DndD [Pseudomonas aeruginosa]HEP9833618.1 DNA sulfur modification protein DndD [Pseudomonas aeruginosa]